MPIDTSLNSKYYPKVKTKKEAITIAIKAYLNQKRRERLASLIGNYEFGYNLEHLEEMRKDD